jgi:hypothetical protein
MRWLVVLRRRRRVRGPRLAPALRTFVGLAFLEGVENPAVAHHDRAGEKEADAGEPR